ncbi:DUF4087 domain-containing protein [Rhizobium sp. TRM95111]|uniref:DUF4087 domain-containing protein n=1 Tax=Rhizobium alarense TaxID=2846851 RepID=UPI001F28A566|nr:DUF4087 domain-containing protein [Rhizobium alarense]MCF3640541.1 DUF4087 domain-containing protein [Rhizobium alarense]
MTRSVALLPAAASAAIALFLAGPANASEMRCGWLQNPTPGNYWLTDRDASWTLLTQGGAEEPAGIEHLPDLSAGDYVRTNGNYGYACACMRVDTDAAENRILAIHSVEQIAIARCRNDASLLTPE